MNTTKTLVMPLGMGDSVVASGAAVVLAKRLGSLRVPSLRGYYESVSSFYVNYPQIEVWEELNEGDMVHLPWDETLRAARYNCSPLTIDDFPEWQRDLRMRLPPHTRLNWFERTAAPPGLTFDAWLYRDYDVPLSEKWDSCPLREAAKRYPQHSPAPVVVHDDPKRGYEITKLVDKGQALCIYPRNGTSILTYCDAIENAEEVHVINSSIWHLTDCALRPKGKLFFHRYARNPTYYAQDFVETRLDWNWIE